MIDNTIPPIGSFPKDDKLRVLCAYGAVYKNIGRMRVPEIKIMLKEILPGGELGTKQIFRKISVAQLDIVRYMTIWRGNLSVFHKYSHMFSLCTKQCCSTVCCNLSRL